MTRYDYETIAAACELERRASEWADAHPDGEARFRRAAAMLTAGGGRHSVGAIVRRANRRAEDRIPEAFGPVLLARLAEVEPEVARLIHAPRTKVNRLIATMGH